MNLLVKTIGFPATIIHGDTLVWDRWRWLKSKLHTSSGRLLDVGCGSGAFTIGAARTGYTALGLSWDERNQRIAAERAVMLKAPNASFEICDARKLDGRPDLFSSFDVAICLETIEHILDDQKLVMDITNCLKPGGMLLLTTPNKHFRPIGPNRDDGGVSALEDGGHVRRGYDEADLRNLCQRAGLKVDQITYCSGFLSQKITYLLRVGARVHPLLGWATVLPLRVVPALDPWLGSFVQWPGYSICLQAHKLIGRQTFLAT